ncbi:MAG: DUF192 domain-containing protein [Youngiibacter sp.]|nr:DUF192 domain-containing protein [Youngiibacter sp.]
MAILINKTGQFEILGNVEKADTFVSRFKGLLGRESLDSDCGLIIEPCNSIHCFFMKFPIDVAFVDKDNQVIKVIKDMKPYSLSPIVSGSRFVIEANSGAFEGKLKEGDKISVL